MYKSLGTSCNIPAASNNSTGHGTCTFNFLFFLGQGYLSKPIQRYTGLRYDVPGKRNFSTNSNVQQMFAMSYKRRALVFTSAGVASFLAKQPAAGRRKKKERKTIIKMEEFKKKKKEQNE